MNTEEVKNMYSEYILPTYTQTPICLVKGKGSRVWDLENREYLDFFPGWAVSGLGHCHPAVVNAIKEQAKKIVHIPNNFYNAKQARLAKAISDASFPARLFFSNSGAEANEAAIKFARKYGSADGRYEIITMKRSFHGRTLATLTATGQDKVQKGFEPLLQGKFGGVGCSHGDWPEFVRQTGWTPASSSTARVTSSTDMREVSSTTASPGRSRAISAYSSACLAGARSGAWKRYTPRISALTGAKSATRSTSAAARRPRRVHRRHQSPSVHPAAIATGR